MQQWISSFFKRISSAISGFSDWLGSFSLRRMHSNMRPSMLKRAMRWPLWASQWALCLPALLVAGLATFAMVRVHMFGGDIVNRYRNAAMTAIEAQDWEMAKTYLGRIVNAGDSITDGDRLQWAMALEQTGSPAEASKVMDALAPEERSGSPLGHRVKAIMLSRQLDQNKKSNSLERLHWHLKNAGKPDGWELNQAWANYYLKLGKPSKAIKYLKAATKFKPEYWLTIAELHQRNGDAADGRLAIEEAATIFEKKTTKDPSDIRSRVAWAKALVRLEQIDRAEEVLLQGLKLKDDPIIRSQFADFYLMRHDRLLVKDPDNFQQQFEYLKRAIDLDVNNAKNYERLIFQFASRPKGENSQRVQGLLESMIAEGKATAMAHFALANILWLSGDQEEAQWHMQQAYKLDDRLVVVANNLAWFLAHGKQPDLDRALELAKDVVARSSDARFRDTLGTVLMKQGKYEEALTEFEKVLPTIGDKRPVHEKLAFIYEKLGKPRLAALHRKNAQEN